MPPRSRRRGAYKLFECGAAAYASFSIDDHRHAQQEEVTKYARHRDGFIEGLADEAPLTPVPHACSPIRYDKR